MLAYRQGVQVGGLQGDDSASIFHRIVRSIKVIAINTYLLEIHKGSVRSKGKSVLCTFLPCPICAGSNNSFEIRIDSAAYRAVAVLSPAVVGDGGFLERRVAANGALVIGLPARIDTGRAFRVVVHECVGLVDRRDGHPGSGHGKGGRGGRGIREYARARGADLPVREVARVVDRIGRDGDLIPGKEETASCAVDDRELVQGTHGFDPQICVSAISRVIDLVQARRGDADRGGDPLVPVPVLFSEVEALPRRALLRRR